MLNWSFFNKCSGRVEALTHDDAWRRLQLCTSSNRQEVVAVQTREMAATRAAVDDDIGGRGQRLRASSSGRQAAPRKQQHQAGGRKRDGADGGSGTGNTSGHDRSRTGWGRRWRLWIVCTNLKH